MEKNTNFFDPYNFSMQQNQPNITPDIIPGVETALNPAMYYEQQYMYYRYLTQVVDYKIKQNELDKLNSSKN